MAQWCGKEWCFTINAPKESDEAEAEEFLSEFYDRCLTLDCKYIAVKGECGESGNYHLQGFVVFKETKRFREIKELFACGSMHLEKRSNRSTNAQAANYVKKQETSWALFPLFESGAIDGLTKTDSCSRTSSDGPWSTDNHWRNCQECRTHRMRSNEEFDAYMNSPEMIHFRETH